MSSGSVLCMMIWDWASGGMKLAKVSIARRKGFMEKR